MHNMWLILYICVGGGGGARAMVYSASEGGNEFQSFGAMYEKERSPALFLLFFLRRELVRLSE